MALNYISLRFLNYNYQIMIFLMITRYSYDFNHTLANDGVDSHVHNVLIAKLEHRMLVIIVNY